MLWFINQYHLALTFGHHCHCSLQCSRQGRRLSNFASRFSVKHCLYLFYSCAFSFSSRLNFIVSDFELNIQYSHPRTKRYHPPRSCHHPHHERSPFDGMYIADGVELQLLLHLGLWCRNHRCIESREVGQNFQGYSTSLSRVFATFRTRCENVSSALSCKSQCWVGCPTSLLRSFGSCPFASLSLGLNFGQLLAFRTIFWSSWKHS